MGGVTRPESARRDGARRRSTAWTEEVPSAQHAARSRRAARIGAGFGGVGLAALLVGATVAITAAVAGGPVAASERVVADAALGATAATDPAAPPEQTPPPLVSSPVPAGTLCDEPAVSTALASGDDDAVVAAFGGGAKLREAVVAGEAPCIDLGDATRLWLVVDKQRAYDPLDYTPAHLKRVTGMRVINAGILRSDAGAALTRLVAAAKKAGAGEIAITSGYRSYGDQRRQFKSRVGSIGTSDAESLSARPGFSEHQSGLATDLVACTSTGCSSVEHFGSTAQGKWVAANSWKYGFIVRYEKGATSTTGYQSEPWHLRYVGVPLATAYHEGGFHTFEEFWNLPAAPDYASG